MSFRDQIAEPNELDACLGIGGKPIDDLCPIAIAHSNRPRTVQEFGRFDNGQQPVGHGDHMNVIDVYVNDASLLKGRENLCGIGVE